MIELFLNYDFCKYIIFWEKIVLGSFLIIFCNKCLLILMIVFVEFWEEYYFCWFLDLACCGIDGFYSDGLVL